MIDCNYKAYPKFARVTERTLRARPVGICITCPSFPLDLVIAIVPGFIFVADASHKRRGRRPIIDVLAASLRIPMIDLGVDYCTKMDKEPRSRKTVGAISKSEDGSF